MIKKLFFVALAIMGMTACNNGPEALVLYYSQTGTTKTVAEQIAAQTGADIEAIDAVEPYSGTFAETVLRGQKEMNEGILPEITAIKAVAIRCNKECPCPI